MDKIVMRKRLIMLILLMMLSIIFFLLHGMNYEIFDYIIEKRIEKAIAMVLVGTAIGMATLTFQAITNNRILTPSILGLDSLYILFQLLVIVFLGTESKIVMNPYMNFAISTILMTGFSLLLYSWLFKRTQSLYTLVLVGVIMGTFFSSINGMLQIMIAPDVFNLIMKRLFADFNRFHSELIVISGAVILLCIGFVYAKRHVLDVLALGRYYSINLGVDYHKEIHQLLIVVFLLIAVSTALVGPITFLGFFSVNIAKNYMKHHRHGYLMFASSCIAILVLFVGQILIEHLFNFGLPISVLINLVGGMYFIQMLLKENRV